MPEQLISCVGRPSACVSFANLRRVVLRFIVFAGADAFDNVFLRQNAMLQPAHARPASLHAGFHDAIVHQMYCQGGRAGGGEPCGESFPDVASWGVADAVRKTRSQFRLLSS